MNKKEIIIISCFAIILLFLTFFGYKLLNYYRYTFPVPKNIDKVIKGLKNYKIYTIHKTELPKDEYISTDNLKIKNILDGYIEEKESFDNLTSYRKELDGKNYIIRFGKDDSYYQMIDIFTRNDLDIYTKKELGLFKGKITDADRKDFIYKNNISNDIDFYKFIAANYFIKSNLFTDKKTLMQNYAFNLFTTLSVPLIDSWTILQGDITGYIFNVNTENDLSVFDISIIDNGRRYGILTNDSRFKDETFMIDFISSIVIE